MYHHAQQTRGLSNTVLACFAMSAVLATAGIMVVDLAPRVWPMLSETEASQGVSFSSCLTRCTASLHVRNVFLPWPQLAYCALALPNSGLAGCRVSLQQQQPVPAGRLWQLQCGCGRAFVSGRALGPSSLSST